MVSQGSRRLALGLTKAAATQLDEFVRAPNFWAKPKAARPLNYLPCSQERRPLAAAEDPGHTSGHERRQRCGQQGP